MRRRAISIGLTLLGAVWVAALLSAQIQAPTASATPVSFAREILPVIEANCLACHGANVQLGKLDLRTRDSALAGGARGAAIVPGNAEQSRLYRFVAGLESIRMPMSADPLAPAQIAAIKNWIDQGAPWDAPTTATTNSAANPLAALERMDITPERATTGRSSCRFRPRFRPLPTAISPTRSIAFWKRSARKTVSRRRRAPTG